jgi:hypothetical protein
MPSTPSSTPSSASSSTNSDSSQFEFDAATTLTALGDGLYNTPIIDGFDINGNANGGYLMALVANALRAESGRAHPISVSMHYLSPGPAGNGETQTHVLKAGKRFANVEGILVQDGRPVVKAVGLFGDLDASSGPQHDVAVKPELPAFGDCPPRDRAPGATGLFNRLDMRLHPDDTAFSRGEVTGHARVRGYFAFADGRPIDTLGLLLCADAFPPVMFNLLGMKGWVPTLEMTVQVRAIPAPGPISAEFHSTVVQGGMWEETGTMWDSTGRCVAMSRQLALLALAQQS